jgi:hypothetical protein
MGVRRSQDGTYRLTLSSSGEISNETSRVPSPRPHEVWTRFQRASTSSGRTWACRPLASSRRWSVSVMPCRVVRSSVKKRVWVGSPPRLMWKASMTLLKPNRTVASAAGRRPAHRGCVSGRRRGTGFGPMCFAGLQRGDARRCWPRTGGTGLPAGRMSAAARPDPVAPGRGQTCSWPRSGRSGRYAASHRPGSGSRLEMATCCHLGKAAGR